MCFLCGNPLFDCDCTLADYDSAYAGWAELADEIPETDPYPRDEEYVQREMYE